MRSVLPVLLVLGLTVYCLVSIVQAGDGELRTLPRWGWLLLVVLVPLFGAVGYLVAGRPTAASAPRPRPGYRPGPKGPDDDEDFLRGL
ncbi:PLDc N-terminal domain-containing protein [Paenibacillus sp. TRM 82003]|uniref:PLDc N-terminal domain-containing protein n=1 Tax=Kineococcus sp. TRM81007 TaxID=2925831 RepID=UPI001F579940|nr:PLDc N-terminal domain-containing protein [Kineococcus sp. TRM81007]MCI2238857.1 PLDc N-terminal domain-containing protein [Kineococcus sp. TRM81007]MCI3924262.1 PLDc N-terminal domain-containing protein [Paenibacillus sp. TRM 82003]